MTAPRAVPDPFPFRLAAALLQWVRMNRKHAHAGRTVRAFQSPQETFPALTGHPRTACSASFGIVLPIEQAQIFQVQRHIWATLCRRPASSLSGPFWVSIQLQHPEAGCDGQEAGAWPARAIFSCHRCHCPARGGWRCAFRSRAGRRRAAPFSFTGAGSEPDLCPILFSVKEV
jgi:hypothetical protein